jgi:hypothetical protein
MVSSRETGSCRVLAMCVVSLASELEVPERVGSAGGERDSVVYLEPLGSAADDARSVAAVNLLADACPFPA